MGALRLMTTISAWLLFIHGLATVAAWLRHRMEAEKYSLLALKDCNRKKTTGR